MENNYAVIIKTCEQVSPDDFELRTHALEVDDKTTVKEINDWYKSKNFKGSILKAQIIQLEKPQP